MDYAVLGALQVAENGDYAGWNIPSSGRGKIGNIGGSMDLAVGAKTFLSPWSTLRYWRTQDIEALHFPAYSQRSSQKNLHEPGCD